MYVVTASQMKEIEDLAAASGTSYFQLMENAGTSVFNSITRWEGSLAGKNVIVLCGSGNNGGDGFVVSYLLADAGAYVHTVLVNGVPRSDEATAMYERVYKRGLKISWLDEDTPTLNQLLLESDIIVDAIYGTGFKGVLPEKLGILIQMSNIGKARIYSIDIPTGMDSDTGNVPGRCFESTVTIALGALKPAHISDPEPNYLGTTDLVDIGIPEEFFSQIQIQAFLIDQSMAYSPLKKRPSISHKGFFGTLLSVCGSKGMVGAAVLVAKSAYRSGVGVVRAVLPETETTAFYSQLVEAVTIPVPANFTNVDFSPLLRQELLDSTGCVIGSGLGLQTDFTETLRVVIQESRHPIVIDGDALTILSHNLDFLRNRATDLILTPHPGEMARLVGKSISSINENRIEEARLFAKTYHITLVLKGSHTVIADPNGKIYVNPTGNPGLAKAGSGDLLAGTIGGLVAQGYPAVQAAISGVYLHGLAADRTASRLSEYSMMATDILEDYPFIFKPCDQIE